MSDKKKIKPAQSRNVKWTDEEFKEAVRTSKSIAQVLDKLHFMNYGANYKTFYKYVEMFELDTGHFWTAEEQRKIAREKSKLNQRTVEETFVSGEKRDTAHLKKIILKEQLMPYACKICNISKWKKKTLSLHLDHINGDRMNNTLENLRFLCPNCHSQTDTYCAKNNRKKKEKRKCVDCDVQIGNRSMRCSPCTGRYNGKSKEKIDWPEISALIKEVEQFGYARVGKRLGVSDKAVSNRIKNHPIDE